MIFFSLNQFIFLFLSPESIIFVVQLFKARFFQLTFYKFIVLSFLGLSPSIFWAKVTKSGLYRDKFFCHQI